MTEEKTALSKPVTRADQLAAFNRKASDPAGTMQTIFDHLANGGHLFDLLDLWGCAYNDVLNWIITDDDRRNMYNSAMQTQSEYVKREVLDTLRKIARFDIRTLYDNNGALKHPSSWPQEAAFAVAGVQVDELFEWTGERGEKTRELVGYAKKVKLRDNLKAFEMIGKNLALFIERHEHTHKHTLEALVMASIETRPASAAPAVIPVEAIPAAGERPIISGTPEKTDQSIKTNTGFFDSRDEESIPTLEPQVLSNPETNSGENSENQESVSSKNSGKILEVSENESGEKFSEKIKKIENEKVAEDDLPI